MLKLEKKRLIWAAILSIATVFIPAVFYSCNFGYGISNNPERWAQFGDFMNIWISMASLILLALLTYEIHKSEESRENQQAKADRMKSSPILVFLYESVYLIDDLSSGSWIIKNSGVQAALNVSVLSRTGVSLDIENTKNDIEKYVSILPGEQIKLNNCKDNGSCKYFALYNDAQSNLVLTVMYNDFNYIIEDWDEILEKAKLYKEIKQLLEYHLHRRSNLF
jgi:hypothetical protein